MIAERQKRLTTIEQLRLALERIEVLNCEGSVSIHAHFDGTPCVYLDSIEDMRRCFPGREASKERSHSRWLYKLLDDGVLFECWEWIQEPPQENGTVTL